MSSYDVVAEINHILIYIRVQCTVKPVNSGHLHAKDKICWQWRCPLLIGFTVFKAWWTYSTVSMFTPEKLPATMKWTSRNKAMTLKTTSTPVYKNWFLCPMCEKIDIRKVKDFSFQLYNFLNLTFSYDWTLFCSVFALFGK